ncbi:MAG: DUF2141 domain-containing protein [Sphingobium sp.]
MFKVTGAVTSLAAALAAAPLFAAPASAAAIGPDADVCARGDSPSVLVRIPAFKERTGKLRVQIYGSNPAEFLAKGQWLKRIDLPITPSGPMNVCVALPRTGHFAVAVRHDLNGDGKSGWNDGGGFSRNPDISLFELKPNYKKVVIEVGNGTKALDVYLNYRQGLAIRPLKP